MRSGLAEFLCLPMLFACSQCVVAADGDPQLPIDASRSDVSVSDTADGALSDVAPVLTDVLAVDTDIDAASRDDAGSDDASRDAASRDDAGSDDATGLDRLSGVDAQTQDISPKDSTSYADRSSRDSAVDVLRLDIAPNDVTPMDLAPIDAGLSDVVAGEDGSVPPVFTTDAPIAAAVGIAYNYTARCLDTERLQLAIGASDTCNGTLTLGAASGHGTYSFTPATMLAGSSCILSLTCSDGAQTVEQRVEVHISGFSLSGTGRYRTLAGLTYPGLLDREITVYLPEVYDSQLQARFPVIYMHDGQNLFDPAQAAFGVEWQVDETIDALTRAADIEPHIVVAIANTAERMSDYTVDTDPTYGGGNGLAYADYLAQLCKPVIDATFRTQPERAATSLLGSSLGGIISLAIYLRHPHIFGNIAAVSPSLWWNNGSPVQAWQDSATTSPRRLWLDIGTAEAGGALAEGASPMARYRQLLNLALNSGLVMGDSLGYLEDPQAQHNEAAWAARLDSILRFLLSSARPVDMPVTDLSLFLYQRGITVGQGTSLAVESTHGNLVRLTWPNQLLNLSSQDSSVATISSSGAITGLAMGTVYLYADHASRIAQGAITVSEQSSFALVTFIVQVPDPQGQTVYLSGDLEQLGSWTADAVPLTHIQDSEWRVSVSLPWETSFFYKFTLGTWQNVEKSSGGADINNRSGTADGTPLEVSVEAWGN